MGRTEKEALELIGAQAEALVRHLGDRSVVLGFKDDAPSEIGSGTCIALGGRFFIATAAHVIDGYTNEELLIVHTKEPSGERTPILRRGARGGSKTDPEDVAFLEIAQETASRLGKDFVEPSRLKPGVPHLPEDNVLVYGYPAAKVDRTHLHQKKLGVQPIGYLSPSLPLSSVASVQVDPDFRRVVPSACASGPTPRRRPAPRARRAPTSRVASSR